MPIDVDALKAALSDRYAIESELGQGAMAVVYLARDARLDRDVALKVLRPDVTASLGVKRFLREIETAAGLTHPHILPLHESGEAGGYLYYAMPYVAGETLRERLDREKMLPVEEACRIAGEVGDALEHAHRHGVVHRDIKPENILLADGHAFVADFGLALALEESGGERLTQTGILLGSPIYSSPEQAGGEGYLDGRADLYSLGIVLYEMLTGEPPFAGSSARATLTRKTTGSPTSPRQLREMIPPHLEAGVMKAISRLPADRFRTVGEFCANLAQAEPRSASRSSAGASSPTSFWKELRRRRVYQTAVAYGGGAWLLVEIADTTFSRLNLPDRAVTYLLVLAILGFPIAIVLAWVYEITRDGVRRT